MTERELFLAVLELSDPHARARYLDQACAGQAVPARKVGALLRSHEEAGTFLEEPVVARETARRSKRPKRSTRWARPWVMRRPRAPGIRSTPRTPAPRQSRPTIPCVGRRDSRSGPCHRRLGVRGHFTHHDGRPARRLDRTDARGPRPLF